MREPMGNFDEAVFMLTLDALTRVIALVAEFHMLTGRWPTAQEIHASMHGKD